MNYIQTRTLRSKAPCTKVQPQIEHIIFSDCVKVNIKHIHNSIARSTIIIIFISAIQPFQPSSELYNSS